MTVDTDKIYDSRVVERNIKAGVVNRKDYEKHLASLEDCADLADETETQMVSKVEEDEEAAADDA